MSILKGKLDPSAESADSGRRSFFWKLGAGVSAALASTVGLARVKAPGSDTGSSDTASAELAVRKLHQVYEQALDKGRYDEVIALFADDAEVVFNGEVFRYRSEGVSRLYHERFQAGKTGKRMEPAPGFELDAAEQQDRVEVSADRTSVTAVFPYSIQVGAPIETETSLAGMARLHGEGIRTWWEGGVYEASYVRNDADGNWRIQKLEYITLSRADYRPGRTYARAISAAPLK